MNDSRQDKSKQLKKNLVAVTTEAEDVVNCVATEQKKNKVLLATALVRVRTKHGLSEPIKALIDQGSMASCITEAAVKKLELQRSKSNVSISGIGESASTKAKGTVEAEVTARYPSSKSIKVSLLILNKLVTLTPIDEVKKKIEECGEYSNLVLADPHLNNRYRIDIILGADVLGELLLPGVLKANEIGVIAQETEFGWILSGPLYKDYKVEGEVVSMVVSTSDVYDSMKKFWEIEEIQQERCFNEDEKRCLQIYNDTVERDETGRFSVALPFKNKAVNLGGSRNRALLQLFQMEKKLMLNPELAIQYAEFMDEYIRMGHMRECKNTCLKTNVFYLPHHAVFKVSTTTKLRVVFNASCKTSNGQSLNDEMLIGPKLQDNLVNIMIRFRLRKIAFAADVAKMYRQILVREEDLDYQRILWRKDPSEPIKEYQLTTVTYGTSAAPFLAVYTIIRLAEAERENFPEACAIMSQDFYMDDVLSGASDLEHAKKLQKELTEVLARGGFPLRKWITNSKELLAIIPENQREGAPVELGKENSVSTLGAIWYHETDQLGFKVSEIKSGHTKRTILSEISKIYDPMGLLAPITIMNKIMMQQIWLAGTAWDAMAPENVIRKWTQMKEQLPIITEIRLDRWINYTDKSEIELHCFADASELAYAAVIYAKVVDGDMSSVNILASKTRIAPIKKISLPRLELCAAVLAVQLMKSVSTALKVGISAKNYYSDSEITLAWIKGCPTKWKTFVANRVAEIQNLSEMSEWRYINTKENPADLASRGLYPEQLKNNILWWNGPKCLLSGKSFGLFTAFETSLEKKREKEIVNTGIVIEDIAVRFSSFRQAKHVLAYCKRFYGKLKDKNIKRAQKVLTKDEMDNVLRNQNLEIWELDAARNTLIKNCQRLAFSDDIDQLVASGEVKKTSKLKTLYPFVDQNGIMRVGGRLQNSEMNFDQKHPIIIPYGFKLTELIIDHAHKMTMHGGNQLTLSQIRNEFWIIGGKRAIKTMLNRCVICHRFRAKSLSQLMGNLPIDRTRQVIKAFTITGTDLCGPIHYKLAKGRGSKTDKGYIVIFICMTTRAIHIELVTDMTAEAFLAAFKRLIARRGNVIRLYCDNGTNFVGANSILQMENEEALKEFESKVKSQLLLHSTKFIFNPPSAPWFGGIWERNIGSIKYHLKRTIADRKLTYEELSTVLVQIEACLNSRPLIPLSENPDELEVLTPGHFLVGSALTAPVEKEITSVKENRLSHWELCTKLRQRFWQRWSVDYMAQLQPRSKWNEKQENLKVGDMVLIKDEITSPLYWPLARVEKIYPGRDNLVRVVDVKTSNRVYKRPIGKLSKLPIRLGETEEEEGKKLQKRTNENQNMAHRKIIHPSINYALVGMLVLFGLIGLAVGANYVQNTFESSPGIFFEKQGMVQIKRGTWRIITALDLDEYFTNYYALQDGVDDLRSICKQREKGISEDSCTVVLGEIERQFEKIKVFNSLIHMESKRNRREAVTVALVAFSIGVVGAKVYDWLFGSNKDVQRLEMLYNEQISVLEKTETTIRKMQEKIVETMGNVINQTAINFEQVRKVAKATEIMDKGHWATSHILLIMDDFQQVQQTILEVFTSSQRRGITPKWLKPDVLREHLWVMKQNLPGGSSLIGDNIIEQSRRVYQLSTVDVEALQNKFFVTVNIPLIHVENFDYYKLIAVPIINDDKFLWLKLSTDFLLVNSRNEFITKSQHELDSCVSIDNFVKLCEGSKQILNISAMTCEMKLFLGELQFPEECQYGITDSLEYWQQLNNENSWLFAVKNVTSSMLTCDGFNP